MQVIHNTVCKSKRETAKPSISQETARLRKNVQYKKTLKHTMLFTIHLQTLEVAKPTRA